MIMDATRQSGMIRTSLLAAVLLAAAAWMPSPARAGGGSTGAGSDALFPQVALQYERVRLALVADDLEAAREPARRIAGIVRSWARSGDAQGERPRLLVIERAATELAASRTLGDAREAFWKLSQPMVAWRASLKDGGPAIAYCPMIKRKWLQPIGPIGNPYAGHHMAGCGEFVNK
ncbi:MAG: hypothetical protein Kow0062_19470 [Acidobacteriota bacterium]